MTAGLQFPVSPSAQFRISFDSARSGTSPALTHTTIPTTVGCSNVNSRAGDGGGEGPSRRRRRPLVGGQATSEFGFLSRGQGPDATRPRTPVRLLGVAAH